MKIYYIMGKSASGKDTIYNILLKDSELNLKTITGYTTRPMRDGEENGREYYFVSPDVMSGMEKRGKIIEKRSYSTVRGVWSYFTADDGQVELDKNDYLLIGTLQSYEKVRDYYGTDRVVPIYIYADDESRLRRGIERESRQSVPGYDEMCRRFLADREDFSKEKIDMAGITKYYENADINKCVEEIKAAIRKG